MPRWPKGGGFGCGPSRGPGWGGPARGGDYRPPQPFGLGNTAFRAVHPDRQARSARRRQHAEQLEDTLYDLALNAESQDIQVAAAARLHAIYEGRPVARVVGASAEKGTALLSDGELRALMEEEDRR